MSEDASHPDPGVEDAVADVTLLAALAVMSPEERLHWNDRVAATVLELRHGFAAASTVHAARQVGGERD